jgi:hypothetical protein
MARQFSVISNVIVKVQRLNDLRKMQRQLQTLQSATGRTRNAMGQFSTATQKANTSISRNSSMVGINIRQMIQWAGAIGAAQLAMKGLNSTIGAAMQADFSKNAIANVFATPQMAKEGLDFIKGKQENSIFTLEDWYGGGKSMSARFKDDIEGFKESMDVVERLAFLDPVQGFEGATFAVREGLEDTMMGYRSVIDRFELSKSVIEQARAEAEALGITEERKRALFAINAALEDRAMTQEFLKKQMETGLGQWTMMKNRAKTALMEIGDAALDYLVPALKKINKWMGSDDFKAMVKRWAKGFAYLVNGFIDMGEDIQKLLGSEQFQEFLGNLQSAIEPVLDRLKDWAELIGTIAKEIMEELIPAIDTLIGKLGDKESALGKVWNVLAPFLTTLLMIKGVGAIGKKLGLDKLFKGLGKAAAFVFTSKGINTFTRKLEKLKKVGDKFGKKGIMASLFRGGIRGGSKLLAPLGGWVGVLIALLIELGFWVYDNRDKIKEWAESAKKWFKDIGKNVKEAFDKFMNNKGMQKIKKWWKEDGGYILERITEIKNNLKEVATNVGNWFKEGWQNIKNGWLVTWTLIKAGASALFQTVTGMSWSEFVEGFKEGWNNVVEWFKEKGAGLKIVFESLKTFIIEAMGGALNFITGFFAWITGDQERAEAEFKQGWDEIKTAAVTAISEIITQLREQNPVFDEIMTTLENFPAKWEEFKNKALEYINPVISAVETLAGVISAVKSGLDTLKNFDPSKINIGKPKMFGGSGFLNYDGSNRFGLANVPFDGYVSELHRGERVLTAKENKDYTRAQYSPQGSRGTINIGSLAGTLVVREEADIEKISRALAKELTNAANLGV